jgi:hypothetical protein
VLAQLWHVLTIQKQHTPNAPHDLLQELREKLSGNYLEISTADNLLKESKKINHLRFDVHTAVEMLIVVFKVVVLCRLAICNHP